MKKTKLFALALLTLFSVGAWATTEKGTYTTRTISEDYLTSTWAFDVVTGSAVNAPTDGVTDNEMIFLPSGSGKIKFQTSKYISVNAGSSIYIPVPKGSEGEISQVVNSASDSRYFELYINGEATNDNAKRLYSKAGDEEGKRGPQKFNFTADDITTKDGVTYLHFKDNGTEMKITSFTVKLTKGTYATCTDPEAEFTAETTAFVNEAVNLTLVSNNTNPASYSISDESNASITGDSFTATAAGEYTVTVSQEADGTYCAVEESVTITVYERAEVNYAKVTGPESGIIGEELTYKAEANAKANRYVWYVDEVEKQDSASDIFVYTAEKGTHKIHVVAYGEVGGNAESERVTVVVKAVPQVIVWWEKNEAARKGIIKYGASSVTEGTIKIHTGKDQVDGINFSSSYNYADGKYIYIKPAEGKFNEGDTINIAACYSNTSEKTANIAVYAADGETKLFTTENSFNCKNEADDPIIEYYVLESDVDSLFLGRSGNTGTYITYLSVVRPAAKDIISTEITLDAVTVNDEELDATDLEDLIANKTLDLDDAFAAAPTVVFTEKTVITYEDDSEKEKTKDYEVTATEVGGKWQAKATINEVEYTITLVKLSSWTVSYYDGETLLGEEVVEVDGTVADNEKYEEKPFRTFEAWYTDAELTTLADLTDPITANTSFYGSWTAVYAESINIEQLVLDEGTEADIETALDDVNIAFDQIDALDSLSSKAGRNESFLGLKLKKAGAYVEFLLKYNATLKVKFGNLPAAVKITFDGADEVSHSEGVYEYTATTDVVVKIATSSDKTVVLKQIMIDEDIEDVVLPDPTITYVAAVNGEVSGPDAAAVGETVELTVKPAEGYKVKTVTVKQELANKNPVKVTLEPAEGGLYSFVMPESGDVEVSAEFEVDATTGLDALGAEGKAVKVVRDGQVVILRDGKQYNALGAELK